MIPEIPSTASSKTSPVSIEDLARALGDVTRWRLLWELGQGEPLPVLELARRVGRSPTLTSKHMGILRKAGLVLAGYGRLYQLAPAIRPQPGSRLADLGHCLLKLDVPM